MMSRLRHDISALPAFCVLLFASSAAAQPAFPQTTALTRQIREIDADGRVEFESELIREYRFGNHVVSEGDSGLRTVLDLQKREVTQVNERSGIHWVLSFTRMRELRERLVRAEGPDGGATGSREYPEVLSGRAEIMIETLSDTASKIPGVNSTRLLHMRSFISGGKSQVEGWFDPSISVSALGMDALEDFETGGIGPVRASVGELPSLNAALRRASGGALAMRQIRPLLDRAGNETGRFMEDTVSQVRSLNAAPVRLLVLPENSRRIPSPLENLVSFAEEEARLRHRGR